MAELDVKAVPVGADRVTLLDSQTDPVSVKSARLDSLPLRRGSVRSSAVTDELVIADEHNTVLLPGTVTAFDLRDELPAGFRCTLVSQRATPLQFNLGAGSALGMTFPGVSAVGQVVRALVVSNAGDAAVWSLEGASEEP
jgi:hypothetical protein